MTARDTVSEKVQDALFHEILNRQDNRECADCTNKSPTWASIDFGVFLCIRCSGLHRQLGPSITRVRSTKLDCWKLDHIEILANVGNKVGNDYWEYKLPKSFKRLDANATAEECKRFVNDKYIKRNYSPIDHTDPVTEYNDAKKNGTQVTPKKTEQLPRREQESYASRRKRTISLDKIESDSKLPKLETFHSSSSGQGHQHSFSSGQGHQHIDLLSGDDIDSGFSEFKSGSNFNSNNNSAALKKDGSAKKNIDNSNNLIELNLSGVEGTCAPNGTLFVFPTSTVNSDKYNQQLGSQSPPNQQTQVQEPQQLKQDSTESKKLDILSLYSSEPVKPQTQNAFNNTNFMGSNLGGFNPAMYQQATRNINYSYPMNNTTDTQGMAYNGVPNYGMNGMNGMNQMGQPNYGTGYMGGMPQSGYNSTAMPGFQNASYSVAGNVNSGYTGTQSGLGYGTNVQVQAQPNVKDANFNIQSLYGNKNM